MFQGAFSKSREIHAGWLLEKSQIEMPRGCEQVVEDLGLDRFIFFPVGGPGEYIDLDWQAGFCWRQAADKKR